MGLKKVIRYAMLGATLIAVGSLAGFQSDSTTQKTKKKAKKATSDASASVSKAASSAAEESKNAVSSAASDTKSAVSSAVGSKTKDSSRPKTASDSEIATAKASGKVWVNTDSGVYHKSGQWYGTTKHGKFMTEGDAVKQGYRAAK